MRALIERLDRSRFQPWLLYYPTALPLDLDGAGLDRWMQRLYTTYRFPTLTVDRRNMRMNRRSRLVLALLFTAGLGAAPLARASAADGTVLPLPPEDQQELTARLGPGVVGQALPSAPITDVSVYFPLRDRVLTYQVTAGKHAGKVETLNVAKGNRPNGNTAWRVGLSPSLSGFLRQTASGDLLMPAVSDSGEGVIVVTTPPNPFLLNGMQPGDSRTFSQSVAVNYLDDPTSQDYSGSLNAKYTYVGTYQVTVPAGTYQAILVRLKYEGKVGPAHTTDTAYYLFAPQVGVVAMVTQEDVEAFWIIHIDSKSGKVLMSVN